MSQHAPADRHEPPSDPTLSAVVDPAVLETLVDAAGALVEESVVRVGPGGLHLRAQDPATVALVDVDLPAEAFDRYDADAEEAPLAVGLRLDRLADLVSLAGADERVRLSLDADLRTLHVGVGELSYTLALVDVDAVRDPPDEMALDDQLVAGVTLPGRAVAGAVRAAGMVADHCALGVDPAERQFYVLAEGDTDAVDVAHDAADCTAFEGGDAHALFSVSYLDAVSGVVPADADATLRLGEDAPVELAFERAGCSVTYLVAPPPTGTVRTTTPPGPGRD